MILWNLFCSFALIGCFAFGGGYAIVSLIQNEVVSKQGWLTISEFINIIAVSESTPGPIAVNTATYVGYKIAGIIGAATATFALLLPPFIIVIALAIILRRHRKNPRLQQAFWGMRPVIIALILNAAFILGAQALLSPWAIAAAVLALVLLIFVKINPILLIFIYGAAGVIIGLM
ncbi:MAG: chromate transporter [Clostridia bacterium]|nr:chromate transporter [Clostridia bacterium]MDD4799050.1 chromate transporter [Clostridia bacterium]